MYSLSLLWIAVRGSSTPSTHTSRGRRSSTRRRSFVDEHRPCSSSVLCSGRQASPVLYIGRRCRHLPSPSLACRRRRRPSPTPSRTWATTVTVTSVAGICLRPTRSSTVVVAGIRLRRVAEVRRRRRRRLPLGAGNCPRRLRTVNRNSDLRCTSPRSRRRVPQRSRRNKSRRRHQRTRVHKTIAVVGSLAETTVR